MATAKRLGRTKGSTTFQKACHGLQPSRRAASSSSFGKVMKACRIRKVPKAENMPGSTMPHGVSSRSRPFTIWYWVMRNACPGIMRIASSNPNRMPRPVNCMRAKAYPAMEHRMSWASVRSTVMRTETQNWDRNGIVSNTFA